MNAKCMSVRILFKIGGTQYPIRTNTEVKYKYCICLFQISPILLTVICDIFYCDLQNDIELPGSAWYLFCCIGNNNTLAPRLHKLFNLGLDVETTTHNQNKTRM